MTVPIRALCLFINDAKLSEVRLPDVCDPYGDLTMCVSTVSAPSFDENEFLINVGTW